MNKKTFILFWSILSALLVLTGLSCDTTKPKTPDYNYNLTLTHTAAEDIIYADFGITTVTLTATLTDEDGMPLSGREILFNWPFGTLTFLNDVTDSNGRIRVEFNDEGYASSCNDAGNVGDCTDWEPVSITATYTDQWNNSATAADDFLVLPLATKVNTVSLVSGASARQGLTLVNDSNPDSLYTISLNAYIRDDNNLAIENIEVHFRFDPEYTLLGVFAASIVHTDQIGKAANSFLATGQELLSLSVLDTIMVEAYIDMDELARVVEESNGLYAFEDLALMRSEGDEFRASAYLNFQSQQEWSILQVQNMYVNLMPAVILLDPEHQDSTYTSTVTVTVHNNMGMGVANVPINFLNLPSVSGNILVGNMSPTFGITNENGQATVTYSVDYSAFNGIDSPIIRVQILHNNIPQHTMDRTILLRELNAPDIDLVANMNTWSQTSYILINNINIGISDTLSARITDAAGGALSGIPVYFTKNSAVGYLTNSMVLTDTTGLARSVFVANPGEIPLQTTLTIDFTITVTPQFTETQSITINSLGNSNILDVDDLHFTHSVDTLNVLEHGTLRVVTKDINGVGVANVPVRFSIQNADGSPSKGILETALVYTSQADTSGNDPGFASVGYNVDFNGIDRIRAYIVDPANLDIVLHEDFQFVSGITISQEPVANLMCYASSNTISVTNADSTYTDTLYAIAQNASGGGIQGVVINFNMDDDDLDYGFLAPSSSIVTDSIGTAKVFFRTSPGIVDGTDEREINFQISTQDQDNTQTKYLNVRFINNISTCPQCVAEFKQWTDDETYTLPADDGSQFATVYAAFVDSLGNGPQPNSIVEFESFTDSVGTLVPFGSITPRYSNFDTYFETSDLPPGFFSNFTGDSILTAQSTFYMTNDAGLATIIATYQGRSDTLYINVESTGAAYVELQPAYPSEIMVEGSGGVEVTELTARVHDGNGNLVTAPYNVRFTLTVPFPAGAHLNGQIGLTQSVVESSNGLASVTLNAGDFPGSVNVRAELFELDDEVMDLNTRIAWAQTIMATITTGPPVYGEANFALQEIVAIGAGNYELPVSVTLWDLHSNPVKDSTNVWLSTYYCAPPFDAALPYFAGQIAMWGTHPTDSLVYRCLIDTLTPPIPDPSDEGLWMELQQPAFIEAWAQTGNESTSGGGDVLNYQGIAWAELYYTSNTIFAQTILKAQTYDGFGNTLIIDSRANHSGQCTLLPFQPGQIFINASPVFHDFSVGPNLANPCRTQTITVNASLIDFYGEAIDLGALQLTAIGAGLSLIPPDPNWIPDWVQVTDPNGAAVWYIEYPIQLCPKTDPQTCPVDNDCTLCEYDDFNSAVWVDLILPVQTQSNQLEITLMRSGGECLNCP